MEGKLDTQTPQYNGKPTAYLDQNILDMFVKHESLGFAELLKSKFQVVYSDENLKEIRRSGNYADQFLKVLERLNAFHLKIVLEQPGFVVTDQATLTNCDPLDAFNEFCQNVSEYHNVLKAMEQPVFKYSGGRVGEGVAEIHDEQKVVFSKLLDQINEHSVEFSVDIPGIERVIKEHGESLRAQLETSLNELERMMKENISDDTTWCGIKDFRAAVGFGAKELNAIEPPNVLHQIWEKYRVTPQYENTNIDIDTFFGLDQNPLYQSQPYFNHQKVTMIYFKLNTFGYYPDSQIHKERRFIASLSDTGHASFASFCNVLFSRDEYFVKKVKAAYEYLNIPTVVQYLIAKNSSRFQK